MQLLSRFLAGLMQRRGNEPGRSAAAARLVLPTLPLHQPWGKSHTKARHRGTWCNDRAGNQRCTIRAWWYERYRRPWFVITMRALDRATRPAHDRGAHRTAITRHPAVPHPQAFAYANTDTLLSSPFVSSCAPIPSRLRHRLESISMCVL